MSLSRRPTPGASAGARAAVAAWLSLLVLVVAGCGKSSGGHSPDAGPTARDASLDVACTGTGAVKAPGEPCGCAADCASGFCAEGLCCDRACTGSCESCNVPGSPGVCSFVPAGAAPPSASSCPKSDVSSCGLDGTCDGAGSCRHYPSGTVCQAGTCQGAAVVGALVCDGAGTCAAGPQIICAPFGCDSGSGQCFPSCRADADCVAGVKCVSGSCGPKPSGAVCTKSTECASGFCADGVCCNVACNGACVSCNQAARRGTCWPVEAGAPDPHTVCHDQGAATCGETGVCDGLGGCGLYKAQTVCKAPSCSGTSLNTAGTCDGLGTCRPPGLVSCSPYHCSAGACIIRCTSDNDCVAGKSCQNGSCGARPPGQACSAAAECASGFCVDGVCCDTACTGGCRSCALPTSIGTCTLVAAGTTDPHKVCTDQGPSSCATNGKCDGVGNCQSYSSGTLCAGERCSGGAYTPSSTCDGQGKCVTPGAISCAPFVCNGSRCFTACTSDAACVTGTVCTGNSCGKVPIGAACAAASQCASGVCAQGVCCATACTGACKSCALAGSVGQCRNVGAGNPDPAGSCLDQGSASCGTDGRCDGAGACRVYAAGTTCKGATCTGSSFTPASTCNGTGVCVTPNSSSCGAFACGASACKTICTANADCVSPAVCQGGTCSTLGGTGLACTSDAVCASGHCTDGFCCPVASCGSCQSCGRKGSEGSCAPVAAGTVDATCAIMPPSSCGTNGSCDAAGHCAVYADGTACGLMGCSTTAGGIVSPQCSKGSCVQTMVTNCAPYNCDPTLGVCKTLVCISKDDCAPGFSCNASVGGVKTCN